MRIDFKPESGLMKLFSVFVETMRMARKLEQAPSGARASDAEAMIAKLYVSDADARTDVRAPALDAEDSLPHPA
jgi:hypothetical protein